jgi:radical SAM protein with 4Fe4S-binding SPASM domain
VESELLKLISLKPITKLASIRILDNLYLKESLKYLKTGRTPFPCKALTSSVFIDSLGNVYPCTIWGIRLGSLRENNYDLEKILASEKTRVLKLKIRKLKCPNCWTPCEAYQTIMGNTLRLSKVLL